jgi:RimJ/RimL family protein N-acetyltransferase
MNDTSRPAIRTATEADLDACARLAAAHDGRPEAKHRDRLGQQLAEPGRVRFLVAELGGEVVGSARANRFTPPPDAPAHVAPPGWYLIGLIVAAAHRGKGIGLSLTRARVEWALEQAGEVYYFTGTANAASLALHSGLGFEEVTRDFWFPGVTFERGGILFRATARHAAGPRG